MGNVLSADYRSSPCSLSLGSLGTFNGLEYHSKTGEPLVRRFLKIPYCLPPVGEYRWKRPRKLPDGFSYGNLDCTQPGPLCPQASYVSLKPTTNDVGYDEDCLNLNIWMPAVPAPPEGWPVLIWFHGGFFQIGDAADPTMDPSELIARRGADLRAIFISPTYRLGILGFLAGTELREEDEQGVVGNYGLWDQRMAIEWVRRNAVRFGGDPDRITLMGRSAGAYSAHSQLAYDFLMAPSSETIPFKSAILYSNAILANPKTVGEAQIQFDEVLAALNIPLQSTSIERMAALRQSSAKSLCHLAMKLRTHTFRPVSDGIFIHNNISKQFANGAFAKEFKNRRMKLLISETKHEETLYRETNPPNDRVSLLLQVNNYYSRDVAEKLVQLYTEARPQASAAYDDPNPGIDPWKKVYGDIVADGQVRAPSRLLVRQLAAAGVPLSDIRRCLVAWRAEFVDHALPRQFGAFHAVDRPLWNFSIMHGPSKAEEAVMRLWIQNLVDFVHEDSVDFGTHTLSQLKVLNENGQVTIEEDIKWEYLKTVGEIASNCSIPVIMTTAM